MVTPLRLHFTKRDRQQPVDVRRIRSSTYVCTCVCTFEWNAFCIMRHVRIPRATSTLRQTTETANKWLLRFVFPDFPWETRNVVSKSDAPVVGGRRMKINRFERRHNARTYVCCIELEFLMIICHVRVKQCLVSACDKGNESLCSNDPDLLWFQRDRGILYCSETD